MIAVSLTPALSPLSRPSAGRRVSVVAPARASAPSSSYAYVTAGVPATVSDVIRKSSL